MLIKVDNGRRTVRDEAFWSKIEINNVLEGKVKFGYKDGKPFGAFISLIVMIIVHIGDLSWTKVENQKKLELEKSMSLLC